VSRQNNFGKRQRETEKARKKRDKAERRRAKRARGTSEVEYTTAEAITGDLPTSEEALATMNDRKNAPRATIPARLFVGGLSRNTTTEELQRIFSEHGELADAIVISDRDTGESRGFGFVTYADRKDAAGAMEALDGAEIDGRNIRVNLATER
jgi:RNA recognition motif-containing protein